MDKWLKIKNKVYSEKLGYIDGIFSEVTNNINGSTSRSQWTAPLDRWLSNQTTDGYLKLSLQEYNRLKSIVNDLNENFLYRNDEKGNVIKEFKEDFHKSYLEIIEQKEN